MCARKKIGQFLFLIREEILDGLSVQLRKLKQFHDIHAAVASLTFGKEGTCPGKEESAEENSSSRSAKGNKYMRRVLNQAAHAAARSKGTHFQAVFRRLLPRLGYKSSIWAIAHRLCRLVWKILHEGIHYIEQGVQSEPDLLIHRAKSLARQLRKFGYNVQITAENSAPS